MAITGEIESLELHRPSLGQQFLERCGLREISPADLCRTPGQLEALYKVYPDLLGDTSAIGPSDFDGDCQSWRGCRGWWREFVS